VSSSLKSFANCQRSITTIKADCTIDAWHACMHACMHDKITCIIISECYPVQYFTITDTDRIDQTKIQTKNKNNRHLK
jgi:hypothetical protein